MIERGPSPVELTLRFTVLLGLIARATGIYLRILLDGRGIWRAPPGRLVEIQQRFARRFVEIAIRHKGGLIKLGQVASLRIDVLPASVTEPLERLQDRVEPQPFSEIERQLVRLPARANESCADGE